MEEALKEAIKIMRGQVGGNPSVFMPQMSESLSELGMLYLDELDMTLLVEDKD